MKDLLIVDLQCPNESHYHDPRYVGSYMWGRNIGNYMFFKVDEISKEEIIILETDVIKIQKQFNEIFRIEEKK